MHFHRPLKFQTLQSKLSKCANLKLNHFWVIFLKNRIKIHSFMFSLSFGWKRRKTLFLEFSGDNSKTRSSHPPNVWICPACRPLGGVTNLRCTVVQPLDVWHGDDGGRRQQESAVAVLKTSTRDRFDGYCCVFNLQYRLSVTNRSTTRIIYNHLKQWLQH